MKKIYTPLATFLFLILLSAKSNAQFVFADFPEQVMSPPSVNVSNTGNDIFDYGGSTYEVSVWDDNNNMQPGLGWKKGTASGFVQFSQLAVQDPDVCIAKDNSNYIYAVVTYYSSLNSAYMIETFKWDASANNFSSVGASTFGPVNPAFGHTLNIDCDDIGNFVIVWDTPFQGVNIVTGHAGAPSTFYNSGNPLALAPGTEPDVTVFYYGASNNVAQVAFINSQGKIQVDNYRIPDLMMGVLNPATVLNSPPPVFDYHFPRIACSNYGVGLYNDWTVVAEDNDGSGTYYIVSFNEHVTASGQLVDSYHVYNDGATGNTPYNTTDAPNIRPVVCYDMDNNVSTGWILDNSGGVITAPGVLLSQFPIALMCDRYANILPGARFEYVPTGISNGITFNCLSLSGKRANNFLYTYNNGSAAKVYTKSVDHNPVPQHLKISNNNNLSAWLNQAIQANAGSGNNFVFRLFDATGKQVFNLKGDARAISDVINNNSRKTPDGIYFANISSEDKMEFSGKVFINNK